jgi:hypothetical protein
MKKNYSWKFNFYFLDQKLQFTYPLASIKDAQATGEAFSPQKRTSSTVLKNMKILDFFLFLWVIFALLDPDPQFECGSGSSNSNTCGSGSGYGSGSETLLKRKSSASKHKSLKFFFFCGSFPPSWSGSGSAFTMRIRIQPTKINVDPCGFGSLNQVFVLSLELVPHFCLLKKVELFPATEKEERALHNLPLFSQKMKKKNLGIKNSLKILFLFLFLRSYVQYYGTLCRQLWLRF